MSLAEKLYRKLLWLYPAEHRRLFGEPMVMHARDMSRTAQAQGWVYSAKLYFYLLKDGLVNALLERGEAVMWLKRSFQPVPWLSILVVIIPGLLIALTRRNVEPLIRPLSIIGQLYILLMIIALPLFWWRKKQFPVWGLLIFGALAWYIIYRAGTVINEQARAASALGYGEAIVLVYAVLALALTALLLRGRRVPKAAWLMFGLLLLLNVLTAIAASFNRFGDLYQLWDLRQMAMISLYGPAEAMLLLAVGLLAARYHGVLAVLVVIGGYTYMFMDSDYMAGYHLQNWSGLPLYLFSLSFAYLVVTPLALLRARSGLARAAAVFVPTIFVLAARLVIPLLVTGSLDRMQPGDIFLSLNILLALILAWIVYGTYEGEDLLKKSANLEEELPNPATAG